MDENAIIELEEQIKNNSKNISTDRMSISISELISLYTRKNSDWTDNPKIIIRPEYQRLFRWWKNQKSKLIESILLRLPIPPIFLAEDNSWKWELIDWLQRISTIFEFTWVLKKVDVPFFSEKSIKDWLVIKESNENNYLTALNWIKWADLNESLKNRFESYRIDLNIVQAWSEIKYDLFDRLNSLSSQTSNQEVRNCLILMKNPDFYKWMSDLLEISSFNNLVTLMLPDKDVEQAMNYEMILRFFAILDYNLENDWNVSNIWEFIDNKLKDLINNKTFNYSNYKNIFEITFNVIFSSIWENAFRRLTSNSKYNWRFILPAFDAIAWWLAYNLRLKNISNIDSINILKIEEIINSIWVDNEYENKLWSKSWVSSEWKIRNAVIYWRDLFSKL